MRWKLALLLALVSVTPASAIQGTLQGDFSCPTKNCKTVCTGPGGNREITGYSRLFVWVVSSPPHVILETDTGHQIMVGAADGCDFAGASTPISVPPIPGTNFDGPGSPPIQPPKICITIPGHPPQCN
jgi:hypothetical protein